MIEVTNNEIHYGSSSTLSGELSKLQFMRKRCPTLLVQGVKLLMKTTKTAQYAADAAKISWRRATVRAPIAPENKSVKMIRTPIARNVECSDLLTLVILYITTTGTTSNTKMMLVIIKPTKYSTRDLEKYRTCSSEVFFRRSGVEKILCGDGQRSTQHWM